MSLRHRLQVVQQCRPDDVVTVRASYAELKIPADVVREATSALKAAMPAAQKKARRQIDVLTRAKERLMELMEEPQK